MEEICNRCVHKVICVMGAAPREVSVITGCYNFRAESPKTNADRFRSMTDEELAQYMGDVQTWGGCPNRGARNCTENCADCWLDWLKQEATP